jgi:hypothetical protein
VLEIPGAIIAGALSSYGVALGSLTLNLRDVAVKGHLPASETTRVAGIFANAEPGTVRILTFHHNVLRGAHSGRMGLANWRSAYRRLLASGADVILCGHDHHEAAGQIDGALAVSTAGTHSFRTRGGRPSVFNLVKVREPSRAHPPFPLGVGLAALSHLGRLLLRSRGRPSRGGVGGWRRPGAMK